MQIHKNLTHLSPMQKITLHPGERFVSNEAVLITTLLCSSIAACLYDPVSHVAGMNHFLLASKRYSRDMPMSITEAGRYGVNAMELLINDMIHLGAEKKESGRKYLAAERFLKALHVTIFIASVMSTSALSANSLKPKAFRWTRKTCAVPKAG